MTHNNCIKYLLFSFLLIFSIKLNAQAPKREFRGAWIATVGNIDWPSKPGLSATQQQIEFVNQLDFLAANGFNAVIVQVRPASDAFYPSEIEPWSRYLTGKQGIAPFPLYDPLAFMVKETHKRNMEFHAWFNPFRALVNSKINPNPASHITKTHPEWIVSYGNKSYLNPGEPEVRKYVNRVILDVVKRYDIDGVHIDDYFYPYKISGLSFNDNRAYQKYNHGLSLEDWRRDNVNQFVEALYKTVKAEKRYVKVGISPFGIWRNQSKDSLGSLTNGTACYDDLYADVKYWIEQKWLDYVAPQLYWEHGHRLAAYDVLVPWWENICKDRALYIGLGVYRMTTATSGPWQGKNEILNQISTARNYKTDGIIAYSVNSLLKTEAVLSPALKLPAYFGNIALPPTMPWLGNTAPAAPDAQISRQGNTARLSWNTGTHISSDVKYVVYKFKKEEAINLNNSSKMFVLTQANTFTDNAVDATQSKYVITALDRLWNESKASAVLE
ncbi:MAG TPA: family 10 glycosylhydrolase [Edaphocola sp.]|nr:family 10 glycosylhydrolase [Edaphocola sp.]